MDFFKGIRSAVGSAFNTISSYLNRDFQARVQQTQRNQQMAQEMVGNVVDFANSTYRNLNQTVQKSNPYAGMSPQQIIGSLGKTVLDQPVVNLTPAGNTLRMLKQNNVNVPSPTIGQTLDFARSVTIQPLARIGAEGVMSLQGRKDQVNFKNDKVGRFLYGDENLMAFDNPHRPAREFLRSTGMNEQQVNNIAPFMIFAGLALDVLPPTSGKGKVAKEVVEEGSKKLLKSTGKKVAKEEALHTLKGLLTYEDELARRGFSQAERAQYSLKKAQELFQWDSASAERVLNQARFYATEKRNTFNKLFSTWIGQREAAATTGVQIGKKYADIPNNLGWDVVRLLENPNAKVSAAAQKHIAGIKQEYDQLYKSAKKAGIDMNYVRQYISHIWKEPQNIIDEKLMAASQKFKFAKERKFMTYDEGIAAGLTPKYTHPAEIIAEYTQRLEQTKANIQFVEALKKEGLVVDAAVGRGRLGFSPINGAGFPVSKSKNYAGEVVQGDYYAPTEIANVINKLFNPEPTDLIHKTAGTAAEVAKRIQDVTLSGGLPKTPFNAFSITAGLQKEFLAGRFSSIGDFIRSFSAGASDDFFKANVDQIKKMQLRNIPVQSTYDISHLVDKGAVKNLLGEGKMGWFDRTMNEPTFKRFFPQLQIHLFNDIERMALQQGKNADEAADIAAQAVKKFYGVVDSATQAKRSQLGEDIKSTFLFAPKFRESMIRVWTESAKAISPVKRVDDGKFALNNPLALENQMNTRFIAGAILTYFAFDKLNEHFTGKHLHENPAGTEDKLLIPMSEITGNKEDTTVLGIPYLSSLATVPRALYGMAKHGAELDFPQVAQDAKAFTSTLFRTPADLIANQNYFGQQIYNPEDSKGDQLKAMGRYAFEQTQHPYVRALSEFGAIPFMPAKDQPAYQTLSKAVELPIRYYTEKKLQGKEYYAVRDEVLKKLTDEEKKVYEVLQKKHTGDPRQTILEANLRLANPNVVRAEAEIAYRTSQKTGQPIAPFYQLPEANQKVILTIQSLPAGDANKSALTQQNIGWLKEYWKANTDFYATINKENPEKNISNAPSAEIQKKLDEYYSLPKGTGQRTAYANANPDLVEYWNQKKIETNQERAQLGLPPMPEFQSLGGSRKSFKPFNRYAGLRRKKISMKIPKAKKVKIKPAKLKLAIPKYKGKYAAPVRIPKGEKYA